ncbi:MAG: tRNA guanosine(15) transglycosylase TgtA [Candidatus Bathyarchaeota archaeon]|nr:MAG: tRNA guanosine(15) transglycosylase TgtA [Candidatus Bathyarchaeota archaeon]
MSFEVRGRDALARLGAIKTKNGTIETPVFLPVINPGVQLVAPRTMQRAFSCDAVITNAYILSRQKGDEAAETDVHEILDFDGVVMTDSGAYQILVYGNVDVAPAEIVSYQESISTDIGTILDIPTKWQTTKEYARHTVDETLRRARQLAKIKTRDDILWVAPIQGGRYLDLVAYSAKKVGELPFQIHALGSPTTVMEQYSFDTLAEMIVAAKANTPPQRPFHLFGAGHPFMFALAVALGCDMFDSAAYAIYARQNRYMTENGTTRLDKLEYFLCSCPACANRTPNDLSNMPPQQRQQVLTEHNLHASFTEIRRIKQSIIEGRLWEHLEVRAHAHPALLQAVKRLTKYGDYIERHSPVTKKSGMFFFSNLGLMRPEIQRHRKRLAENYLPPKEASVLILLPPPSQRPYHKAKEVRYLIKKIRQKFHEQSALFHVCVFAAPFGVIPLELDEVYPLSQCETAEPFDIETINHVAHQVMEYVRANSYKRVVLAEGPLWRGCVSEACRRIMRKDLSLTIVGVKEKLSTKILDNIVENL